VEWIITIAVAIIGCVVSILTYFAGQKRTSNNDVEKSAYFQGEMSAKIDQVIKNLEKLDTKLTRNTGELHDEIDKKILDHERRYHNAGHN
jgi:hypothetical protein